MKPMTTTKKSAIPDDEVTFTREHWKNAEYRIANKKVTKAEWAKAARAQLEAAGISVGKKRISIMLDGAIIDHFKAAAGERGYQTLINEALRKAVAGEQMVNEVREVVQHVVQHVVREELAAYQPTQRRK
jgi:uncharacterized protein (DUF4415 family)